MVMLNQQRWIASTSKLEPCDFPSLLPGKVQLLSAMHILYPSAVHTFRLMAQNLQSEDEGGSI
jgi:hypothetical protein